MRRFIIAVFILCFSIPVFAEINPYIAVRGGYEKSREKLGNATLEDLGYYGNEPFAILDGYLFNDNALTASIAIGTEINKLRIEAAYSFKKIDDGIDSGLAVGTGYESVKQHTIMANLFYYPLEKMIINPFVGGGAGVGIIKSWTFDTKVNFAYALYIGADYTFAKHFTLELMGTYNSIISPYSNAKDVQNFGGSLGVRYNFN